MNIKFKKLLKVAAISVCALPILCSGTAFAAAIVAENNTLVTQAAVAANTPDGVQYIDTGGGTTGTLTITLSPGVQVVYNGGGLDYAIVGMNTNVKVAVRNEYGVSSDYEGYYMRRTILAEGTDLSALTDDNSDEFAAGGWTRQ